MQRAPALDALADVIFEQSHSRARKSTIEIMRDQGLEIGAASNALNALGKIGRVENRSENALRRVAYFLFFRLFVAHPSEDLVKFLPAHSLPPK
jgi:hypothetical protein